MKISPVYDRLLIIVGLALSLGVMGCSSAAQPSPSEPGSAVDEPGSAVGESGSAVDEPGSEVGESGNPPPTSGVAACPPARAYEGMCIQMIAYAKNPATGECCQYPTPCSAPEGWQTFGSRAECQAD